MVPLDSGGIEQGTDFALVHNQQVGAEAVAHGRGPSCQKKNKTCQLKITRQHKTACKRGVIMKVEAFIYEQGDKEFEVKIQTI